MHLVHEFAFDFAPSDEDWLRTRLQGFGATERGSARLRTLFVDTPDGLIAKLGFALGLRRRLNSTSARASLRARPSSPARWTRFIENLAPSPRHDKLDAALQTLDVREALALVVTSDSVETFFDLRFGSAMVDIRIELSHSATAGGALGVATATFRHASGGVGDFLRAVGTIADPAKLRLSAEAAMIRARRRLGLNCRCHVGAFAPRLGRAMDKRQAFREVAWACVDQFLLNEGFVRDGGDVEAVHQCRVALRRLRTALKLFKIRTEDEAAQKWRHERRAISALLRDVRDLDVLTENVAQDSTTLSADAAHALVGELKLRRKEACAKLGATLESEAAKRFYLELALWIEAGDFGDAKTWQESFVAFVNKRLAKATERLRERGEKLAEGSDEERHRTRIAAKNLRYGAEFLEGLLSHKSAHKRYDAFLAALKDIQEILGDHNDEIVARQFFTGLAERPHTADPVARAAVVEAAQAVAGATDETPQINFLDEAERAFRDLADVKPFWAKMASE